MYFSILIAIGISIIFLFLYIFVQKRRKEYPKALFIMNVVYSILHQFTLIFTLLYSIYMGSVIWYIYGIFDFPEWMSIVFNMRIYAPILIGFILFHLTFKSFFHLFSIENLTYDAWHYQKGNWLSGWYTQSFRYNEKRNYTKNLYKILKENFGNTNDNEELVFISPSANEGLYEENLFNHFRKENKKVTFILSDLVNLESHVNNYDKGQASSSLTYLPERNAQNIKETLQECGIVKCHVIYDHKGFLWHTEKSVEELENKIKTYHHVLNDKGLIVIDAYKSKTYLLNNLVYHTTKKCIGYMEASTYIKFRKQIKSSEFIRKHFNLKYKTVGKSTFVLLEKRTETA